MTSIDTYRLNPPYGGTHTGVRLTARSRIAFHTSLLVGLTTLGGLVVKSNWRDFHLTYESWRNLRVSYWVGPTCRQLLKGMTRAAREGGALGRTQG